MADYNSIYTGAQIDSAIGALSTALQPSDISAFESSTQLNNRDSANRNRSNHTGTQLASTISDFETAVDNLTLDSANVLGLIDSAHVQLRQDYAYASLTDAPNVLDSADVSLIAGGLSGWGGDSATVLGLIDSASCSTTTRLRLRFVKRCPQQHYLLLLMILYSSTRIQPPNLLTAHMSNYGKTLPTHP